MRKRRIGLSGLALAVLLAFSPTVRAEEVQTEVSAPTSGGDAAVYTPSKPMELLSPSETKTLEEKMADYTSGHQNLLQNQAEHFYYYENLDPMAKEIYDVLYGVAQDPVSEGNIGIVMTDMDPSGEEFYYEFNVAYLALTYDHPELFWIYAGSEAGMCYCSEAISQNGFYIVYFKMEEPFEEFEEQMTAFNQAADDFLADINTGISEYSTIRQIHDKLIDLVNYNDPVLNSMGYATTTDLAHTAYGALVCDSSGNSNYPVCDGYSLAFEYLLQQCGIETVLITGVAGDDEETAGGHAWNMVKLDGAWYEVDSTWDDVASGLDNYSVGSVDYNVFSEALSNVEYRERAEHFLFLLSTDEIRHFIPGEELSYYTRDGAYVWHCASESVHIRSEKDELQTDLLSTLESSVISLAPTAAQAYAVAQ